MPIKVVNSGGTVVPPRVQVAPPVTQDDLALIPPGRVTVQFAEPLSPRDHEVLGAWAAAHGDVDLRAYGTVQDLDFLAHYPVLSGLTVDSATITDDTGLGHLAPSVVSLRLHFPVGPVFSEVVGRLTSLSELSLGENRVIPGVVSSLTTLRKLHLAGPVRRLPSMSGLTSLTSLSLWNITVPDLICLLDLPALESLEIVLGGTTNLTALAQLPTIRSLSCERVRGLRDIAPLTRPATLQTLRLGPLGGVTALPTFQSSQRLTNVALNLDKLTDLDGLAAAPSLTGTVLITAKGPDDVNDLAALRHLRPRDFSLSLDTKTRTMAAWDVLQIPGTYWGEARP